MIQGVHALLYAEDAAAARAFFRDVLELPAPDEGDGWPIFALPPAELACHPGNHATELYLMCTDIEATRKHLEAKGVEFTQPVSDQGWGLVTQLNVPGFGELGLYQPRHQSQLPGFTPGAASP